MKDFYGKKISENRKKKKFSKKFSQIFFFFYFFFRFFKKIFRRNLSYDEYITHTKFQNHRSRGSRDTGCDRQTQDEDLLYRSKCHCKLFYSSYVTITKEYQQVEVPMSAIKFQKIRPHQQFSILLFLVFFLQKIP